MSNTPEIKNRILKFIKTLGISVAQFERRSCLSNGYIRNFKGNLGSDKFEKIINAFPMLNRQWLATGEGSMIIEMPEGSRKIPYPIEEEQVYPLPSPNTFASTEATELLREIIDNYNTENKSLRSALEMSQRQVLELSKAIVNLTENKKS